MTIPNSAPSSSPWSGVIAAIETGLRLQVPKPEIMQRVREELDRARLQVEQAHQLEIETAHIALDEIGVLREDGMGVLTLAGRCWALSNRWSAEHDALRGQLSTAQQEIEAFKEEVAARQREFNDLHQRFVDLSAELSHLKGATTPHD